MKADCYLSLRWGSLFVVVFILLSLDCGVGVYHTGLLSILKFGSLMEFSWDCKPFRAGVLFSVYWI